MKPERMYLLTAICLLALIFPAYGQAQTPAPAPPKVYSGSFGAGLSLTRGNTETVNFNLSFNLIRDPKTRNVFKANALYLRSSANDVKTADRLSWGVRDEYAASKRAFVYGALAYLRDPFQDISYLLNPQGGFGYKPYETGRATLAFSGGVGFVVEKDRGLDARSSGTVNAGQGFNLKVSEIASVTQDFRALWKTDDFNDSLYHFGIALATSITTRSQLKVEFIDDYKNITPSPLIQSNDSAVIISFLFKF